MSSGIVLEARSRQMNAYLTAHHRELGIERLFKMIAMEGGQSSETYRLDCIDKKGASRSLVLRLEPRVHAVYENCSVARQFQVLKTIASLGGVPVPAPVLYEPSKSVLGSPFFLMRCVEGRAPPGNYHGAGLFADVTAAERERLYYAGIAAMAAVHTLDTSHFEFLGYEGEARRSGIAQELARWESYRHWTGRTHRVLEEARRWLMDNIVEDAGTGLAWGDARPGNILFGQSGVSAILDWETASLGGAETDLGWWIFYDRMITEQAGQPRLAGLPGPTETISAWEQFAGRKARHMDWHLLFAGYRLAMIMEHTIHMGLASGRFDPSMTGDGNLAIQLLDKIMACG